jgi:hypothetical protein
MSSENASTVGDQVTFTATVAPSSGTGEPGGSVTFTIDGKSQTPVALKISNGYDHATFSIATLSAGAHTVSAAYSGDSSFEASTSGAPFSQTVVTPPVGKTPPPVAPPIAPPTVTLVQRFGVHMQPTVLVLTFSSALDPARAENASNYIIVNPSGKRVAIAGAAYNPAAHTVTLHPSEKINLHHNYRLVVSGTGPSGIAGADLALLDGADNGDPGSNFLSTLNWKDVVLTPALAAKLHRASVAKPAGALAHRLASRKR